MQSCTHWENIRTVGNGELSLYRLRRAGVCCCMQSKDKEGYIYIHNASYTAGCTDLAKSIEGLLDVCNTRLQCMSH